MIGSSPFGASAMGGPGDDTDPGIPAPGLTQWHQYVGSTTSVISIRQGDSIGLKIGLNDESLSDWVCDVAIKTHPAQDTPEHEQTLAELDDDDTRWIGVIAGSVTEALDERRYIIVADLYNDDTGEAKEYECVLIVSEQSQVIA